MYDEEINMRQVIEGDVALVADVYTRSLTIDGYTPWVHHYRVGANQEGKTWAWYWDRDREQWKLEIKAHDNFVFVLSELLGIGGPNQAKAEVVYFHL